MTTVITPTLILKCKGTSQKAHASALLREAFLLESDALTITPDLVYFASETNVATSTRVLDNDSMIDDLGNAQTWVKIHLIYVRNRGAIEVQGGVYDTEVPTPSWVFKCGVGGHVLQVFPAGLDVPVANEGYSASWIAAGGLAGNVTYDFLLLGSST